MADQPMWQPNLAQRLGGILAGKTRSDQINERLQAVRQSQMLRDLPEYAQRLGLTPEEQLMARMAPAKFFEQLSKRAEPVTLNPGQTRSVAGQSIAAMPTFEKFGDQIVRVGGEEPVEQTVKPVRTVNALGEVEMSDDGEQPGQVEALFKRDRTYAEDNDAQKALADVERQIQTLELRREALRQGQQRIELAGQREGRMAATAAKKPAPKAGSKPWERSW
jgi:hypothetical protein